MSYLNLVGAVTKGASRGSETVQCKRKLKSLLHVAAQSTETVGVVSLRSLPTRAPPHHFDVTLVTP